MKMFCSFLVLYACIIFYNLMPNINGVSYIYSDAEFTRYKCGSVFNEFLRLPLPDKKDINFKTSNGIWWYRGNADPNITIAITKNASSKDDVLKMLVKSSNFKNYELAKENDKTKYFFNKTNQLEVIVENKNSDTTYYLKARTIPVGDKL